MPHSANVFLPMLKPGEQTGWQGAVRKALSWLGPTWRSSPVRRFVQSLCLLLFLYAFLYVAWPYSSRFSTATLGDKEWFPVELFLLIDPLSCLSTLLAAKVLHVPAVAWMVGIVLAGLLVPRGFCGYLCPLGTLIDAFDWLIGRHFRRLHLEPSGPGAHRRWWVHVKYYLLVGVLVASLCGVLLAGFVSAIAVLTRGLVFTAGRLQLAVMKGTNHLPPVDWTFYLSIALFAGVFLASLLGKRFWCRYVCPSGALFSVLNAFRLAERKVRRTCIRCNRCVEVCPLDAIREDFTTRTSDCAFCQTCGGVCPTQSIQFVTRWNKEELPSHASGSGNHRVRRDESGSVSGNDLSDIRSDASSERRPLSRRGFVAAAVLGAATSTATRWAGGRESDTDRPRPIRPPGSVPEAEFLDLCIRCGECFKVCPGPVLHPAGLEYGLEGLWTPVARLDHAGCHQDCNFCTQVCPTGAIRPLDILVKQRTRIGLARIDSAMCLPLRRDGLREDCDLCRVECEQAGYRAIKLQDLRIELNPPPPEGVFSEMELEAMSRIRVPVVDADACVGCGICQYRCHTRYVIQQRRLPSSAIVVVAENEQRRIAERGVP